MAANTTPIFTLTPRSNVVHISTANTNRDGTGTLGDLGAAGTNGSLIFSVRVIARGTVTNGVVRLFIYDGSTAFLWHEILVPATTPSTTVQTFEVEWVPTRPKPLPSGYHLKCSTNNAEDFNVGWDGGDF